MSLSFAESATDSRPLILVSEADAATVIAGRTPAEREWIAAAGFKGTLGQLCVLPAVDGRPAAALFGTGTEASRRRGRFHVADAAAKLPEGVWRLEGGMTPAEADEAALGWLLASYGFGRYKAKSPPKARLVAPPGVDARRLEIIANAESLTRDLINTPASDMGPDELEAAFLALASRHGAAASAIRGDDLLAERFPMVHAVGRASDRAPRLLDMTWGSQGPTLTLIGKGVCFDTGGLDIKPATSMGLMKKDMGGAATVMGLADMIMSLGLKLRLRVIVPAVENAISGGAFRPQDILTSRKGLTVEINNTDAEGRLILADALALADEGKPDLIVSMATLTGAARVAVGPDLAPFFTDDDPLAAALAPALLGPIRADDRARDRRS